VCFDGIRSTAHLVSSAYRALRVKFHISFWRLPTLMSSSDVDTSRRRFLTGAVATVGGIGGVFAAVPFVAAWSPSDRAKAIGAPVDIDISKLEAGQAMVAKWQGKPVVIVRRTEASLANIKKLDDQMRDPQSENVDQQPGYATNEYRSIKSEVLVAVGLCTHLGCAPTYNAPPAVNSGEPGGFFCPCHGSRFDLAGRVYQGVPAPTNLLVPPHKYLSESLIRVGEDSESA
jgi:ubiquinol-cytochrome c reductase iron-sulfur subunit